MHTFHLRQELLLNGAQINNFILKNFTCPINFFWSIKNIRNWKDEFILYQIIFNKRRLFLFVELLRHAWSISDDYIENNVRKVIFLFQEWREDSARLQSPGRFGAAFGTCVKRRQQKRHSSFINDSERILKTWGLHKGKKQKKSKCLSSRMCAQEGQTLCYFR